MLNFVRGFFSSSRTTQNAASLSDADRSLNANTATQRVNFENQARIEHPDDVSAAFKRTFFYAKESLWLKSFLQLKRDVINFELDFKPGKDESGKEPKDGDVEKLNEWLDSKSAIKYEPVLDATTKEEIEIEIFETNRSRISKFIDDVLVAVTVPESAVAYWTDKQKFASLLNIEKCGFTEDLGQPMLKYTHGLSRELILRLPPEQQERFTKLSTITLNPAFDEHFKVFKRTQLGEGFGVPTMFSAFRTLSEVESKEKGMRGMSFLMEIARRVHKLGHEIKAGNRAGLPWHFINAKKATAMKDAWGGTNQFVGVDDTCVNFDHEITYPWPDMKYFDETCWKGTNHRMMQWGGPLAQLIADPRLAEHLMPTLKAEILAERKRLRQFLTMVINQAWKPQPFIDIEWSNTIFNTARLAAELLKFGAQAGWVSRQTGQEEIGLNPKKEDTRKVAEADDPDVREKSLPLWDAAHGMSPALGETTATIAAAKTAAKGASPSSQTGKPPGTQDAS